MKNIRKSNIMLNEKSSFKEEQREKGEEILTLNEATKFLKLSKSFMYKMTSQKLIVHFIPGGKKIYFKKTDLEDWLLKNRIPPSSELEIDTEFYLSNPLKTRNNG
jgi:excisionase family DNA binding protein